MSNLTLQSEKRCDVAQNGLLVFSFCVITGLGSATQTAAASGPLPPCADWTHTGSDLQDGNIPATGERGELTCESFSPRRNRTSCHLQNEFSDL